MRFALSAQEKDTLYDFQEYEIVYSPMQLAIDKVIDTANSCSYFNLFNKKYYIIADLDSNVCTFRVYPHNVSTICLYKYDWKEYHKKDGICCYRETYIYILDHSNQSVIDDFFSSKDSIVDIFLDKNENISEQIDPFHYFCEMSFNITGDTLIRKPNNVEEEEEYNYLQHLSFQYIIKNGDTWETISKKCGCSIEDIQKEYSEYERPLPGLLIAVKYRFDENNIFQGLIRWNK